MYALTPWGDELRETVEALIRWSFPLMTSGRGGNAFQPRWLAVALEALLRGKTAEPPAEVAGLFMNVRIDKHGPHVIVQTRFSRRSRRLSWSCHRRDHY